MPTQIDASAQIKNLLATNVAAYNFPQQATPENLSPSLRTVTLAPVPPGVNATDTSHYVGIYNNAGTWQENALINGGTAVSGAATGTVTFVSLAGTYATGAYKIGSATSGIQEAVIAAGTFAVIRIPAGYLQVNAQTYIPAGSYISIRGAGQQSTRILALALEADVFHFAPGSNIDFGDLSIDSTAWRSTSTGVWLEGVGDGVVSNLRVAGQNVCILARSCARVFFSNLMLSGNSVCMQFDASSFGDTCHVQQVRCLPNVGGVGLLFKPTCSGVVCDAIYTEGGAYGIRVVGDSAATINELQFSNLILDSYTAIGFDIFLSDPGAVSNRISLRGAIIASVSSGLAAGGSYAIAARSAVAGQIKDLTISDVACGWYSNGGAINSAGMIFGGTQSLLVSNATLRSGEGFGAGIEFTAPGSSNTSINGGRVGQSVAGASSGAGVAQRGILIGGQAHSDLFVDGVRLAGSIATAVNSSTDLATVEFTDTCRSLPIPAVASAAALAIPAFPQFTISGTTGVTSVTGLGAALPGRSGTFITTSGAVTFTAGATIGSTGTTTQNKLYVWQWDGAKFWVVGPGF